MLLMEFQRSNGFNLNHSLRHESFASASGACDLGGSFKVNRPGIPGDPKP
jgi:hypothetical protein